MARFQDREKARVLRSQGKSYSEIKLLLGASKGTLSVWLRDMPLSPSQIRELRDLSPKRIEKFRATMKKKRDARMSAAYQKARLDIGGLSKRDIFIAGLYLYWAEGTKTARGKVEIANTDPAVIQASVKWLRQLGVRTQQMSVKLQLYRDMNIRRETNYWADITGVPQSRFRKPYIKDSRWVGLTRKHGHGHGTCNLIFDNVPMWEYITGALTYIRECQTRP